MASLAELEATLNDLKQQSDEDKATRPRVPPKSNNGNNWLLQTADDAARRFADGASMGYADKLSAGMGTGFGYLGDYDKALKEERQLTEDAGARLGHWGTAADIAGGIGGAVAGGGLVGRGALALAGVGTPGLATAANALRAAGATSTIPVRALNAAANAGVAGRAAVGAAEGAGFSALDAAGHDKKLTGANLATGAAVGGALGGGLAALGRARMPTNLTTEQQRLAGVLQNNGIELTAGQRTGSKPLKWLESTLSDAPLSGGPANAINARQAEQLNAAVNRTMGSPARTLTVDDLTATQRALGNRLETIAGRNTLAFDQPFATDVLGVVREYGQNLNALQKPLLMNMVTELSQAPTMSGAAYQKLRSRLGRMASGEGDTELARAYRGLRDALDGVADRSMTAGDAPLWRQTNRQYTNYKTAEKAMKNGNEGTAIGNISPSQLRNSVVVRQGEHGDLGDLSRAGAAFLKPLPNSGTGPRTLYAALATGSLFTSPLAAAMAIGGPALASRALYSRPVQRFLGSGAAQGPAGWATSAGLGGGFGSGLLGGTEDEPARGPNEIVVRKRPRQ